MILLSIADGRIGTRGDHGAGDVLPIGPFLVPIQDIAVDQRTGAVLECQADRKAPRLVGNGAGEALGPAADDKDIALVAADREILIDSLVGLRIAIQAHPVVGEEGGVEIIRAGYDCIARSVHAIGRPECRHTAAVLREIAIAQQVIAVRYSAFFKLRAVDPHGARAVHRDKVQCSAGRSGGKGGTVVKIMNSSTSNSNLEAGVLYFADVELPEATRASGLKVRPTMGTSQTEIGVWPHGRLAVVRPTSDSNWLECRYRGQQGYVSASYLTNFRVATDGNLLGTHDTPYRLLPIAQAEVNALYASHPKFYKYGMELRDANGNYTKWCHMFVDWLSAHAFWGTPYSGRLPMVDNCKEGVRWFLEKHRFVFINETFKTTIFNNVNDMRELLGQGELTTKEIEYLALEGDYVYFYSSDEENQVSSHVALVVGMSNVWDSTLNCWKNSSITIAEGNVANRIVRVRTITRENFESEGILGFGEPDGFSYG